MLENWEKVFSEMLRCIYDKEGKDSEKLSLLNRSYCLNKDIVGERVTEVMSKNRGDMYGNAVALYNNLHVFQIPVYSKVDVGSYAVKKVNMTFNEE